MEAPPVIPPGYSPSPPPPVARKTSGFAIASLVLGIFSMIGGSLLLIPPLLAVVFGHVSLGACKKNPALTGHGLGLAGLIMGYASVCLIGLFAAMAIPAFAKVREVSIDKAVLNNARQLAAATDQYYLESTVMFASRTSLIGPTNYVRYLDPIAGETYPAHYTHGITITVTGVAGARTITYAP